MQYSKHRRHTISVYDNVIEFIFIYLFIFDASNFIHVTFSENLIDILMLLFF